MLRVAATACRPRRFPTPAVCQFHASAPRREQAKETPEKGFWKSEYNLPLGVALAVPALKYEWYLVNEETQLAACLVAFSLVVYKQFGGIIYEALEEDGKRILEEHNINEDADIAALQAKIADLQAQQDVVQDARDVAALKADTYEKLNAAGKVKPLYDFKVQVEKLLSTMQSEEANMTQAAKQQLMAEATTAVRAELANPKLQKACLANAMALLQGKKSDKDPVKEAYMGFFRAKQTQKMDEAAEAAAAKAHMITKLNAVARSEGFLFELDANGQPKMVV